MNRLYVVAIVSLVFFSPFARAESGPKDLAARTELHSIETLTLSDTQFLTGDANGKPTITSGQFRIAQGSGRLPVIVLQHGSGGMGANIEMWQKEFNTIGVSTFALDGFTGRGLTQVSTDQKLLGRLNFVLDIYRALNILATHPRVDAQRIVLMGFSRGGQAALYASLNRFHQMWNKAGRNSSPTFRSTLIAQPLSRPIPKSWTGPFAFTVALPTTTIRYCCVRTTSNG